MRRSLWISPLSARQQSILLETVPWHIQSQYRARNISHQKLGRFSGAKIVTARRFRISRRDRIFGLDVGDWSIFVLGVALAGALIVLF